MSNLNPYANKYPGAGPLPQANPSDGGSIGIGSDMTGTQLRDWSPARYMARVANMVASTATGYLRPGQYGFTAIFANTNGSSQDVPNGFSTDGTTCPAFEMNGLTSVPPGTVVEMWSQYSTYPAWAFVSPTAISGATVSTTCKTVVTAVTCSSGSLMVTYDIVRVVDVACP